MPTVIENDVRGVPMRLAGENRAMTLCARMNYETEVLDFIDALPTGSVLYDLGACEGRFAIYAALKGITCYAFEPEAMNFAAMVENIGLNEAGLGDRMHPQSLAVGDRVGTATMKIGQPWAAGHHKVVATAPGRLDLNFDVVAEQEIALTTLDAFVAESGHPFPDYLKVDVDGSELPFMLGAAATLADPRLKGLIFELCKTDASYETALETLTRCGFAQVAEYEVNPGLFNVVFRRAG